MRTYRCLIRQAGITLPEFNTSDRHDGILVVLTTATLRVSCVSRLRPNPNSLGNSIGHLIDRSQLQEGEGMITPGIECRRADYSLYIQEKRENTLIILLRLLAPAPKSQMAAPITGTRMLHASRSHQAVPVILEMLLPHRLRYIQWGFSLSPF